MLLAAVQRAIFCPSCSTILDIKDATMVEADGYTPSVFCGDCWKEKKDILEKAGIAFKVITNKKK